MRTHLWNWNGLTVAWNKSSKEIEAPFSTLLIHGFGANKEHWRHNQNILGTEVPCYAIDLIGFGESSQPPANISGETKTKNNFCYNFENWSQQITDFSREIINEPVLLIGNSIGAVIALRAAQKLKDHCKGVILINCAQRMLDDKQLINQTKLQTLIRPVLKSFTRQRWISKSIFKNAAKPSFIQNILKKAYPSQANLDKKLISILHEPTKREGAPEAFHGFINIFDDYLAPELMNNLCLPVDMIWGQDDPWESITEAQNWFSSIQCIRSLSIIPNSGHCPHDETPEKVNPILLKLIQQAI